MKTPLDGFQPSPWRRVRNHVATLSDWFNHHEAIKTAWRGESWIERILAGATLVDSVMDSLWPTAHWETRLFEAGMRESDGALNIMLYKAMVRAGVKPLAVYHEDGHEVTFDSINRSDEYLVFFHANVCWHVRYEEPNSMYTNDLNIVSELARKHLWESPYMIFATRPDAHGNSRNVLIPNREGGLCVGSPTPADVLESADYEPGDVLTVMLVGPSGAGKSTLAYHMAQRIGGEGGTIPEAGIEVTAIRGSA